MAVAPRSPSADPLSRWALVGRLTYVGVVALATLSGLDFDLDPGRIGDRLRGALAFTFRGGDAVDAARNLLLFAGWGAVWVITAPGDRLPASVRAATLSGALLSVSVELVQALSRTRTTSILDVATNTGGAFAGAVLVLVALWAIRRRRASRSFVGIPALLLAVPYTAAVAMEALIPLLRQELLPGAAGGPVARLGHALSLFEWNSLLDLPLLQVPLFAPAGALLVAALAEAGRDYRSALGTVAVASLAGSILIELTRGALSQPIVAGAALTHAAAIAAGAWAAARWLPGLTTRLRGRHRPLALFVTWAVILTLWSWRPYLPVASIAELTEPLSMERLIPLSAHGMRFDLFSVVDVARQFCLILPLGALLAVWPLRRTGLLQGPLPAVYLAVGLEAGQLFVAGRMFDSTDALVGVAAALLGWVLMRRTGFPIYGEALRRTRVSG
jgi:glycopeptide antibiotics resistance protein